MRELANLVGFKPRPGIAATTHLAYLLDPSAKPVEIKPGAKAQTVPLPDEKMQTFETDEKLYARAEWSQMKPRQSRLTNIDMFNALTRSTIRLAGTSVFVRPGERVLFVFSMKLGDQVVREVLSANINIELGFVELTLKPRDGLAQALLEDEKLLEDLHKTRDEITNKPKIEGISSFLHSRIRKQLLTVLSSYFLGTDATGTLSLLENSDEVTIFSDERNNPFGKEITELIRIFTGIVKPRLPEPQKLNSTTVDKIFNEIHTSAKRELSSSGIVSQKTNDGLESNGVVRIELAQAMMPVFQEPLNPALREMQPDSTTQDPMTAVSSVYLLRAVVSPFGTVAPKIMSNVSKTYVEKEWILDFADKQGPAYLETVVDAITPDSFAIVQTPLPITKDQGFSGTPSKIGDLRLLSFVLVRSTQIVARNSYNLSSKVTKLELADADSRDPLKVSELNLILLPSP
ncbi:MAG: hypothetical protein IPH22_08620 [Nitrosomonas sp.]|nr:hypothetical protein [Nitrosomonas sp.]